MTPNAMMLLHACDIMFDAFKACDDPVVEINIHGARRHQKEAADHFNAGRAENAASSLEAAAQRLRSAADRLVAKEGVT